MPDSVENVTILGVGAMATVCAMLLVRNGHRVTMWGHSAESIRRLKLTRVNDRLLPGARIPDPAVLTADDRACFDGVTLILSAVPVQHMRSAWVRLREHTPDVPIVSVSKGIELDTLLSPTRVIADVLGGNRSLAIVSGPNIAAEIAQDLPAMAVAASSDCGLATRVQFALSTASFRVYTNTDIAGVELAGAVKNVIALAAGILDGLAAGNNVKAALVARGLVEISRLGMAVGAEEATFNGLAGLGDLITTCVSPQGRNRTVGERIGRGEKLETILDGMESVAEGVPTTRAVLQLARRLNVDMPITEAVHGVLFGGRDVRYALTDLMTRDRKPERSTR